MYILIYKSGATSCSVFGTYSSEAKAKEAFKKIKDTYILYNRKWHIAKITTNIEFKCSPPSFTSV